MKKYILLIIFCFISLIITGCNEQDKGYNSYTDVAFNDVFESLNDSYDKDGNRLLQVTINKENPFIIANSEYVMNLINKGESIYLFVGSPKEYYTRLVVEEVLSSAISKNIDKIYFVNSSNMSENDELFKFLNSDLKRSGLFKISNSKIDKSFLGFSGDKEENSELTVLEKKELLMQYNLFFED